MYFLATKTCHSLALISPVFPKFLYFHSGIHYFHNSWYLTKYDGDKKYIVKYLHKYTEHN